MIFNCLACRRLRPDAPSAVLNAGLLSGCVQHTACMAEQQRVRGCHHVYNASCFAGENHLCSVRPPVTNLHLSHILCCAKDCYGHVESTQEITLRKAQLSCVALQTLDLGKVYDGVLTGPHIYRLRSMVCYYGQHYMAYVFMHGARWYLFDDSNIIPVGSWQNVVSRCAQGRAQASLLFFHNQ